MRTRKKFKTESIKKAVKKAKHQPRHIRAAAQKAALYLSFFAVLGAAIFSGVHVYKSYSKETWKSQEKPVQTGTEKTSEEQKENTKQWYDHRAVAHALGEIDGKEYTNSKDAFLNSYEKGFKVFEVDLMQTTDHVMVARHYWGKDLSDPKSKGGSPVSYAQFKRVKLYGKYTSVSLKELFELMDRYPDTYIMTDTKDSDAAAAKDDFSVIVRTAEKMNKKYLLDRLIVQIYNQPMYYAIKQVHPFRHVVYTTYKQTDVAFSKMIRFCKANGIEAVTVPSGSVNDFRMELLSKAGIYSFTHTVNSVYETREYMKLGVYGVYTDYLTNTEVDLCSLNLKKQEFLNQFLNKH
ncbi:phosphatidylinositol-specific phospholipase C/glycerophosphodiester phosphodiesterase family protein [Anaerostipes sp.]|uniref:phosphatidylinositol-specific phospholipase C/glycerophosphodiester phosphodiesterase family protein n=1 Tax=Anaerostipes sp. TaxID=1872530 RepID=UPI0025C2BD9F|nr:phosphatidylinositol-specific phospholipase C/glycerophosphodiester phosphodiesterase family protein [Anaerostipes sp.]MBS7006777.1 glycerophosphodiester phosphodiesterase [Anaerostipes sp.]